MKTFSGCVRVRFVVSSFDNWVRLVGGRDVWIDPRLGTEPMPKVIDKRLVTETDLRRGAVVLCQRPREILNKL